MEVYAVKWEFERAEGLEKASGWEERLWPPHAPSTAIAPKMVQKYDAEGVRVPNIPRS